jgi:hypothetical protein
MDGLSARAQPSALETSIAAVMRKLAMTSSARDAKNPVDEYAGGAARRAVALCRSLRDMPWQRWQRRDADGRGMYPKPPDLRVARTQERSDGEIFLDH